MAKSNGTPIQKPGAANGPHKPAPKEMIARGQYNFNVVGVSLFVGLRLLDPILQYGILRHSWTLGGLATVPLTTPGSPTLALGLPLPRLLLLAMAAGTSVKQIIWICYVNNEDFAPGPAVGVSAYNTLTNGLNSMLLVTAATSAALSHPQVPIPGTGLSLSLPIALGTALYTAGILLELVSELQRKRFKDDPANKGKVVRSGLWAAARHINYGGYTLWRMGYCLAGGSWATGLVMGMSQALMFAGGSMQAMDKYMEEKYGEQWRRYKRDVPYKLIPGVW